MSVFSKNEKITVTINNGKAFVKNTKKVKGGFSHEILVLPTQSNNVMLDFDAPVKIEVMKRKGIKQDVFSNRKILNVVATPSPNVVFEQKTDKNTFFIQVQSNNTFKNVLPDDAIYFVEMISLTGKDKEGKVKVLQIKNETAINKTNKKDFQISLTKAKEIFAENQEINVKLENVYRINAEKQNIAVILPKDEIQFVVKL